MKRFYVLSLSISMLLTIVSCHSPSKVNGTASFYNELHRPQFHFTPPSGWMNDPNGMVYHNGEYHLFYQYYPDSIVWGPMHWGHAISSDLLHWQHLPIALYPDSLGYIFSGSAIIDHANSSGLGSSDSLPMIAFFTYHDMDGERNGRIDFQSQSLAYSVDQGRTFHKYDGNPLINNPGIRDFRDPKVIRDEARQQWILVLAAYDKVMFYKSVDLINWTSSGEFGIEGDARLWECPDLIHMRVSGSEESKWVLITSIQSGAPNGGTATSYFVGEFEGNTFIADPNQQNWLDFGKDNYAFVTWTNLPPEDNRVIGVGWMSNWQYAQQVPSTGWRSAMTLPREITLHRDGDSYFLRSQVIREFSKLTEPSVKLEDTRKSTLPELALIKINLPATGATIRLSNDAGEYVLIGYNSATSLLYIDRSNSGETAFSPEFPGIHTAPCSVEDGLIAIELYLDRSSIELFAQDGLVSMTELVFPTKPYKLLEVIDTHSNVAISAEVSAVRSSWSTVN